MSTPIQPCTSYRQDSCNGTYRCTGANCPNMSRYLWGGDDFATGDSSICAAALHQGVLGIDGGLFRLVPNGPVNICHGSKRNGVTARSWGEYANTFRVMPADGGSSAYQQQQQPQQDRKCVEYVTDSVSGIFVCPGIATCPRAARAVWGHPDPECFTGDSSPCAAARARGVIGEAGGRFRLVPAPGRDRYEGFTRGGVNVRSWGSYRVSFTVHAVESNASSTLRPPSDPVFPRVRVVD